VEGDAAPQVYRRRTGRDPSGAAALHLGIAPLLRAGGDDIGALAEACRGAGRRVGLLEIADPGLQRADVPAANPAAERGAERSRERQGALGPAGLVAMDRSGRIAVAEQAPPETPEAEVERCLQLL